MNQRIRFAISLILAGGCLACSDLSPPAVAPAEESAQEVEYLTASAGRWAEAREDVEERLRTTAETLRETVGLTRTGCLTLGDEADPYILTERDSGEAITVVGSPLLAAHVDQLVRLHGRSESDGRVFHVTKIEPVAPACEAAASETQNLGAESIFEKQDGLTADDQGNSAADLKTTQAIRKAVVGDRGLSAASHNVKIITRNGFVTLRGSVANEAEKRIVEQKAAAVAGAARVGNELTTTGNREQ